MDHKARVKRLLINCLGLAVFAVVCFGLTATSVRSSPPGLIVVCDLWPPYQMLDSDRKLTGFSVEVVDVIFRRMNLPVASLRHYPWKRAMAMLEAGEADALFSANKTFGREAFAFYPAVPLVNSPWVCWTRKSDNLIIDSIEDLAGKRIGVVAGYSYTQEFWNYIRAHSTMEVVSNDETNFRKLDRGRLDVIVAELGNGLHIRKTFGYTGLRPQRRYIIKDDGLFVMFSRKSMSREVVQAFSEQLAEFKREQWYFDLKKRYLSEN